ncbi:MFS transporter [Pseudonocardia sp. CA-142604]|uniref:MFS transporter n=1 Tax=Pseudonocardia sp. CA-142604 TaxID=3240024 RepID=UPI003D8F4FCF
MSPGRRYGFGFWSVAAVFLTVIAFSTAPGPLYTLYRERDAFSALVVTIVYAAYAVGAVVSLVLAGHLSDSHGRRRVIVPALLIEIAAAVVFLFWPALPGLIVARSLTGLGVGAFTSTATAWLGELHAAHRPRATNRRAQVVGTASNMWGFGVGTMLSGALAQWAGHPLTVPYLVFVIALVVGLLLVLAAPETRAPMRPRTRYRPQRVSVPHHVRGRYLAAATGMFVVFAAFGLFTSVAPSYLSGPLHHPSVALAGTVTFVVFTSAVAAQLATSMISVPRLLTTGIPILLVGLALLVAAVWLPTPSLAGFLTGGVVTGLGGGILFRGTLSTVVTLAPENARAEALAGLFVAGYLGLTIPVIGLGLLIRYSTPQVGLLVFATALALAVIATAPALLCRTGVADERTPAPLFSEVSAFSLATAVRDGHER